MAVANDGNSNKNNNAGGNATTTAAAAAARTTPVAAAVVVAAEPAKSSYFAIRKCDALKLPAIFTNWEDCSFYIDQVSNDEIEYEEFDNGIDVSKNPVFASYVFGNINFPVSIFKLFKLSHCFSPLLLFDWDIKYFHHGPSPGTKLYQLNFD